MASLASHCILNLLFLLVFLSLPTLLLSFSFNYTPVINYLSFLNRTGNVSYQPESVELTWSDNSPQYSAGRLYNSAPFLLYDHTTGLSASFNCSFRFQLQTTNNFYGDGLAFVLLDPTSWAVPINGKGAWLGLFNSTNNGSSTNNIVAVEFDTYQNSDFLDPNDNHIGVDVNDILSRAIQEHLGFDMKSANSVYAWIDYSTSTGLLDVYANDNGSKPGAPLLSYKIKLSDYLPPSVLIGFSAATGESSEHHILLSWSFNSTGMGAAQAHKKASKMALIAGLVAGLSILLLAAAASVLMMRKKKWVFRQKSEKGIDMREFPSSTYGPRKFTYKQLKEATKQFSSTEQLGEGGFGVVYRGMLPKEGTQIAVKCVSQDSKQGEKEFRAEVTIISRIRHKHLVELKGWCHDKNKLLLVYEYLPNGSLDQYLFHKATKILDWGTRFRVVCELGSALQYLHEECENVVIHRDVKASNVMLDAKLRAKLGDFGLARQLRDGSEGHETIIAGTRGYMAPECSNTGRATKESDVYSYGAVLLEVVTGKRPLDVKGGLLVEWVWSVYGKGVGLGEVADERLRGFVEEEELTRVVVVGLACSHPDPKARPTISQALDYLRGNAPLPAIPVSRPVAYYAPSPPLRVEDLFSSTSSIPPPTLTTSSSSSSTNNSATPYSPLLHSIVSTTI